MAIDLNALLGGGGGLQLPGQAAAGQGQGPLFQQGPYFDTGQAGFAGQSPAGMGQAVGGMFGGQSGAGAGGAQGEMLQQLALGLAKYLDEQGFGGQLANVTGKLLQDESLSNERTYNQRMLEKMYGVGGQGGGMGEPEKITIDNKTGTYTTKGTIGGGGGQPLRTQAGMGARPFK